MAIYTATLSAQNTSVYVCDLNKSRNNNDWFANAMATGTFGTGTVSFQISYDGGTTKLTMNQDGTATAASLTAAGALNLRGGVSSVNAGAKLYATIGAATNPSVTVIVITNE